MIDWGQSVAHKQTSVRGQKENIRASKLLFKTI